MRECDEGSNYHLIYQCDGVTPLSDVLKTVLLASPEDAMHRLVKASLILNDTPQNSIANSKSQIPLRALTGA